MNITEITEEQFAQAVNSRSSAPIYQRLKPARVGVAGLGGLGSNIAAALARGGVGHLTVADFDRVELSNINRQLYTLKDIGRNKTDALTDIIAQINPFCEITARCARVTAENCTRIFADCDIVCEAFDLPDQKAMLVNTLLEKCPEKYIISGSGMAGSGRANEIVTRRITDRFYLCGDGKTDAAGGEGLTAARVMICAGHQASKVIEIILSGEQFHAERK
ncbi:MAG: sulfur carrier protein ThiS adenylyltransferase ThiF [Oscillospiraceae bacterium]